MNTSEEILNKSIQKFFSGRNLMIKAKILVFCPVSPGRIRVECSGSKRVFIGRPFWKKYNNTFWWYCDIVLHRSCISISIHTLSPVNSHMRSITTDDGRHEEWNGMFDSEIPDWWHRIDLSEDSPDFQYKGPWDELGFDKSYYLFAGSNHVVIGLVNSRIGIAAL